MSPLKKRIVWDLDDTLNTLTHSWLDWFYARNRDARRVRFEDLRENPPNALLGIPMQDYLDSLDAFRISPEARDMQPVPAVRDWFREHGFCFEHHVLTARPIATIPHASGWLFTHFGRWIRHFHFVPARRVGDVVPDENEPKARVIERLGGAEAFVDDSPANLEGAGDVVANCILVPQPWNGAKGELALSL
ncbi:MAG: hypothetical protein ACREKL_09825, partial [Chthoniobacterales bacterium]